MITRYIKSVSDAGTKVWESAHRGVTRLLIRMTNGLQTNHHADNATLFALASLILICIATFGMFLVIVDVISLLSLLAAAVALAALSCSLWNNLPQLLSAMCLHECNAVTPAVSDLFESQTSGPTAVIIEETVHSGSVLGIGENATQDDFRSETMHKPLFQRPGTPIFPLYDAVSVAGHASTISSAPLSR